MHKINPCSKKSLNGGIFDLEVYNYLIDQGYSLDLIVYEIKPFNKSSMTIDVILNGLLKRIMPPVKIKNKLTYAVYCSL